ncbi:MAG: hypothetical protein LBT08_04325 [Synergistaceae bacterium]|nr:hypothetical protein [Synergistaceae bacterium]
MFSSPVYGDIVSCAYYARQQLERDWKAEKSGVVISRRTVAKYRSEMGTRDMHDRRSI